MKKLLAIAIALTMIITQLAQVNAKVDYVLPEHIEKAVALKGYEFKLCSPHEWFENGYEVDGKTITYQNVGGYLKGVAYAYDKEFKKSETVEFKEAIHDDYRTLIEDFEIEVDDNLQHYFIQSFMLYCLNDNQFEKSCKSLHDYMKNHVMPFVFTDVSESAWYRGTVEEAYYLGLMTGATETLFKPNANMTRGMVATVLHRIEGSVHMEYFPFFKDLKNNKYYTQSVIWCYSTGIINGYKDSTFKPNKNITREEMAQMLYNYAMYKKAVRNENTSLSKYADEKEVSSYHRNAMQWAVENGLISGKDNGTRLDPQGLTTRAEASKMILKTLETVNNE